MEETRKTILDMLEQDVPLGMQGQVQVGDDHTVVLVGLDPGNSAAKVAVVGLAGNLVTVRVPNSYLLAEEVKGGDADVMWQVNGGGWMWLGDAALKPPRKGNPVTQGATDVRLASAIQRDLLICSIIEALTVAKYPAGAVQVMLGYAVPTDEVTREGSDGRMQVERGTRTAIAKYIDGQTWQITRRNERGKDQHWTLCIVGVQTQSQTLCAMLCFTRDPTGRLVTEFDGMVLYDFGHHDTQKATIVWKPKHQLTTERLGDGMRAAAQDLIHQLQIDNNQALAAHLLTNPQLMRRGRFVDVHDDVQRIVNVSTEPIIQKIAEDVARTDLYIGFLGGGLHTFRDELADRLRDGRKQKLIAGDDYRMVSTTYCVSLNAIGALFATRFAVAKQQAQAKAA